MTLPANRTTSEKKALLVDSMEAQSEAVRMMADHFRNGLVMDDVGDGQEPQASLTMTMADWETFLSMMDSTVDRFNEFGEFFARLET